MPVFTVQHTQDFVIDQAEEIFQRAGEEEDQESIRANFGLEVAMESLHEDTYKEIINQNESSNIESSVDDYIQNNMVISQPNFIFFNLNFVICNQIS